MQIQNIHGLKLFCKNNVFFVGVEYGLSSPHMTKKKEYKWSQCEA